MENWEDGFERGLDKAIDILKANKTLSHNLKRNLINKLKKEIE